MAWAEGDVFDALNIAVSSAAYWQAPLDIDENDPMGVRDYRPIAEQILRSPGIAWWRSAVAIADQWYVDLLHDGQSASEPPCRRRR